MGGQSLRGSTPRNGTMSSCRLNCLPDHIWSAALCSLELSTLSRAVGFGTSLAHTTEVPAAPGNMIFRVARHAGMVRVGPHHCIVYEPPGLLRVKGAHRQIPLVFHLERCRASRPTSRLFRSCCTERCFSRLHSVRGRKLRKPI
jgi:hypothetical protein